MDFVALLKEYGPWTTISFALTFWVWGVDKRSRRNEQSLDTVHSGCQFPQGTIEEMKTEIDELKDTDSTMQNDITEIKTEMREIKDGIAEIKQILQHFTIKGMEK